MTRRSLVMKFSAFVSFAFFACATPAGPVSPSGQRVDDGAIRARAILGEKNQPTTRAAALAALGEKFDSTLSVATEHGEVVVRNRRSEAGEDEVGCPVGGPLRTRGLGMSSYAYALRPQPTTARGSPARRSGARDDRSDTRSSLTSVACRPSLYSIRTSQWPRTSGNNRRCDGRAGRGP